MSVKSPRTGSVDIPHIEHVASMCPYLFDEFIDADPPEDLTELIKFCKHLMHTTVRDVSVEVFAVRYDVIAGNLNCPLEDNDIIREVVREADEATTKELTKKNCYRVPRTARFPNDVLEDRSFT
ncbi:hypothetical protein ACJJTC_017805 [Scirpophaga incertulas]